MVPVCGVVQRGRRCKEQNFSDWSLPFERFCVCVRQIHATHHGTIALLERAEDAMKAFILVKARRPFVISTRNAVAPSYLQGRVERGQPLPSVTLLPVMDGKKRAGKRRRELCNLLAFVLGKGGGPEGEGMPRDVFRVMLDMLSNATRGPAAAWHRKRGGEKPSQDRNGGQQDARAQ